MFGYVTVYEPELKMKDYRRYKAYYCGLCSVLKERFGSLGQLTLTYDMTFAILLLTSLYESETRREDHRCKVHPVKKQAMLRNEMTEYAADMNVVLSYYHLKDDWEDERKLSGLAGSLAFRKKAEKVIRQYPRQCGVIQQELRELQRCEQEGTLDIDRVSGCFGRLMGEMLVYREDHWQESLRRLGFFLGKFIYIMDAFEDLEKDLEKNLYNPLKPLKDREDFVETCRQMLCMMMAECSAEFEKLPCIQDVDILRNILYAGVWNRYRKKVDGENQEQRGHFPSNDV